jgi:hypothetical protein
VSRIACVVDDFLLRHNMRFPSAVGRAIAQDADLLHTESQRARCNFCHFTCLRPPSVLSERGRFNINVSTKWLSALDSMTKQIPVVASEIGARLNEQVHDNAERFHGAWTPPPAHESSWPKYQGIELLERRQCLSARLPSIAIATLSRTESRPPAEVWVSFPGFYYYNGLVVSAIVLRPSKRVRLKGG